MYRFALVPAAVVAALVTLAAPALSNDRFTGLPIAPGVKDNDPANASAVCNGSNHVRASTFSWPTSTPASSIANWYEGALPGSAASTLHLSVGVGVTEYVVSTSTSRIIVFDELGRTLLKIEHAEKPLDFNHAQKNSCSEAS
jgi:hypothetical protein